MEGPHLHAIGRELDRRAAAHVVHGVGESLDETELELTRGDAQADRLLGQTSVEQCKRRLAVDCRPYTRRLIDPHVETEGAISVIDTARQSLIAKATNASV